LAGIAADLILLAAPWLSIPAAVWLTWRRHPFVAGFGVIFVWLASFWALVALQRVLSGGKLVGGPSAALGQAFRLGGYAVVIGLVLVVIVSIVRVGTAGTSGRGGKT
jgi:hypothetical protein